MNDVNAAWDSFDETAALPCSTGNSIPACTINTPSPSPSPIYISTRTRIAKLKTKRGFVSVDLSSYFWKIAVIPYWRQKEGVTKKQMKFVTTSAEQLALITSRIDPGEISSQYVIRRIENPDGKIKFKDVRKITLGLSKKDITSYRSKQKGAFYNCFALVIRVLYQSEFHEIHVKVFNTGKLEIPGVQNEEIFRRAMELLCRELTACAECKESWTIADVSTVLINSNFSYISSQNRTYKCLS